MVVFDNFGRKIVNIETIFFLFTQKSQKLWLTCKSLCLDLNKKNHKYRISYTLKLTGEIVMVIVMVKTTVF